MSHVTHAEWDQDNRLKRAEEERHRLALAMESIAESLGVDAGRLAEDPWAVAESALQKAVAAEREACAKIADARACAKDESDCDCCNDGGRREAAYIAELIRARGQEPKT